MSSTPILEKEALETFKRWFGDRPIINMGPFDFPVIDESGRLQTSKESAGVNEVMTFLSTALQKHGPKSVIYVGVAILDQFVIMTHLVNLVFVRKCILEH